MSRGDPDAPPKGACRPWRIIREERSGQSLIETCLVMAILCLVFMGFFQVSQLIAARQILSHAAARGARAKMVGFNRFMVDKSIRVATIPTSGRMIEPDWLEEDMHMRELLAHAPVGLQWDAALRSTPPATLHEIERARIPAYLGAPDWGRARGILHYEHWHHIRSQVPRVMQDGAPLEIRVQQTMDLRRLFGGSLHRAFYARDFLDLEGVSRLEAHYPLYIDDRNW